MGEQNDMKTFLLTHATIWRGGLDSIFDGYLQVTSSGNAYVAERTGVPSGSVGFWLPDHPLPLSRNARNKAHCQYRGAGQRGHPLQMAHVGFAETPPELPVGALVRVSLARWWRSADAPDMEKRCYAQVSGWFL